MSTIQCFVTLPRRGTFFWKWMVIMWISSFHNIFHEICAYLLTFCYEILRYLCYLLKLLIISGAYLFFPFSERVRIVPFCCWKGTNGTFLLIIVPFCGPKKVKKRYESHQEEIRCVLPFILFCLMITTIPMFAANKRGVPPGPSYLIPVNL